MEALQNETYTLEQREAMTKKEYKRLAKCFSSLDEGKREVFDKLLNEAAFLGVTLGELRQTISREGVTDTYRNSATQYGSKPSAAIQTYDKLLNTYNKVIGQLRKELPEEEAGGELLQWLRDNPKPGRRDNQDNDE